MSWSTSKLSSSCNTMVVIESFTVDFEYFFICLSGHEEDDIFVLYMGLRPCIQPKIVGIRLRWLQYLVFSPFFLAFYLISRRIFVRSESYVEVDNHGNEHTGGGSCNVVMLYIVTCSCYIIASCNILNFTMQHWLKIASP